MLINTLEANHHPHCIPQIVIKKDNLEINSIHTEVMASILSLTILEETL